MTELKNLLALDIGEKRIGVARVNLVARLPEALTTILNDQDFLKHLQALVNEYEIDGLVVGLPRNLQGEETAQSRYVRDFCQQNLPNVNLPIFWQDETLSSVTAEEAIKTYKDNKQGIDAVAAKIILEDYLKKEAN